jgi:hypothetical protein
MGPTFLMNVFRRRLASGALALTVLQFALLFAAPVSACCQPGAFRSTAAAASIESEIDCCPPGSHAPGQCPLHKNKDRGSKSTDRAASLATEAKGERGCRMVCDAPHGPTFVLGFIGIVGAPQSNVDVIASALPAGAASTSTARPSLPDAPPPRLL